ncbi:NAD(+) diphosphatase [Endozoicomonas sp. Mp262]|uniref:NAD(+) diphosphatase n=1 Tax=Endozoicomonas sp. Mp262 TaxID=2919499 RepID=UPI0021DB2CD8
MTNNESPTEYQPLQGWDSSLKPRYWLVFHNNDLVLNDQGSVLWSHQPDFIDGDLSSLVTGYWRDEPVASVDINALPDDKAVSTVRSVLTISDPSVFALLSHAIQLRESRKSHQYCGCCGNSCAPVVGEWAMKCQRCQNTVYPRISPCIIVLVSRKDELLLVRHQRHGKASAMYTVIAGFIEPGESAEEAVHREVMEEAGVRLSSVNYQFSQSWPFPHSLMLGFRAEYAGGELKLDQRELCDGGWFKRSMLPELPPLFTISRQLIDRF